MTVKAWELLELYENSKEEFFSELIALLTSRITDVEHSIFAQAYSAWRCQGSTLRDPDEIRCLRNILKTEFNPLAKESFAFSETRRGVRSHIVLPLRVRGQITGVWVMECLGRDKLPLQKEHADIAKVLALLLQSHNAERDKMRNYYLDPTTSLPGKAYFIETVKKLDKMERKFSVCAMRYTKARERVRMAGYERAEEEILKLPQWMREIELGNVYCLSEDTFAIITIEPEPEVYARISSVLEGHGKEGELKGIIIRMAPQMDIMREIESIMSLCPAGTLKNQQEEQGPLSYIFEPDPPKEPESQNPVTESRLPAESEAGEIDILGLLGREDAYEV